jgi:hypothetical protein
MRNKQAENINTVSSKEKVYTWESGIVTNNPITRKFYESNTKFRVAKRGNTIIFVAVDEDVVLLQTGEVLKLDKADNGYVRIETKNSVYNLILAD